MAGGDSLNYFQKRRAEILGSRKRKPRRCDVAKQAIACASNRTKLREQLKAIRRLEAVW